MRMSRCGTSSRKVPCRWSHRLRPLDQFESVCAAPPNGGCRACAAWSARPPGAAPAGQAGAGWSGGTARRRRRSLPQPQRPRRHAQHGHLGRAPRHGNQHVDGVEAQRRGGVHVEVHVVHQVQAPQDTAPCASARARRTSCSPCPATPRHRAAHRAAGRRCARPQRRALRAPGQRPHQPGPPPATTAMLSAPSTRLRTTRPGSRWVCRAQRGRRSRQRAARRPASGQAGSQRDRLEGHRAMALQMRRRRPPVQAGSQAMTPPPRWCCSPAIRSRARPRPG